MIPIKAERVMKVEELLKQILEKLNNSQSQIDELVKGQSRIDELVKGQSRMEKLQNSMAKDMNSMAKQQNSMAKDIKAIRDYQHKGLDVDVEKLQARVKKIEETLKIS